VGDTPFTGLGSGVEFDVTLPEGTVLRRTTLGAPNLTRIANTQVVNNDANKNIYTSAGSFTANPATDFILAIVPVFSHGTGATSLILELGDIAFTQLVNEIMRPDRSFAVFYLKAADIPTGANTVELTSFIGATPTDVRAAQVEFIEFSWVDQSSPVYFCSTVEYNYSSATDMETAVVMQGTANAHVDIYLKKGDGVSVSPSSSNKTILCASETGISNASSVSSMVTYSEPGAVGTSTHLGTWAVANFSFTKTLSVGVRAA
jgi:hypothetical protein